MDKEGPVTGRFAVRRSGRVEIRVFYGGKGVLRIDNLSFRRVR